MKRSELSNSEFKKLLKKLGLTQKEFAEYIGVSEPAVKSWMGSNSIPYYAEMIVRMEIELRDYRKYNSCVDEILGERIKNILLAMVP